MGRRYTPTTTARTGVWNERLESPMLVLANASYRDNIESLISRLYSDLHEKEMKRVRCPEMRKSLGLLKRRNAVDSRTELVLNKFGEKYIEQGIQLGIEKGIKQGRLKDAGKMIAAGFHFSTISEITEIPVEEIEMIEKEIGFGRMEEKMQIASRMLHAGFPVATISSMTDLSEAEIAAIGK